MVDEVVPLDNIKDILLGYADVCMYMKKAKGKSHKDAFVKYVKDTYGTIPNITNDDNICGNMCLYSSLIENTNLLECEENFKFVLQKVRNSSQDKWKVLVNKESEESREIKMNRILRKANNIPIQKTTNTSDKDMPYEYLILMRWFKWLDYDALYNNTLDTYNQYEVSRDWLTGEMHSWFDLDYYPVDDVNKKNQMHIWFEFNRSFDKQSLIGMKPYKEYEIKKRYNGYTMVEICNS